MIQVKNKEKEKVDEAWRTSINGESINGS